MVELIGSEHSKHHYSRSDCIPQIAEGHLISEDLKEMTVEKCDLECHCKSKDVCIRIINLLSEGYEREAKREYRNIRK